MEKETNFCTIVEWGNTQRKLYENSIFFIDDFATDSDYIENYVLS